MGSARQSGSIFLLEAEGQARNNHTLLIVSSVAFRLFNISFAFVTPAASGIFILIVLFLLS